MSPTKVVPIPVMGRHSINAYLLLGRRPVVVDAGTPGSGGRIRDQIAAHGVDPTDVSLIVITHGHIDHFGSAAELHRLTGAPVAGHIADLGPYRSGRAREPYLPTGPMGRLMARSRKLHLKAEPLEPGVLVRGETDLEDFGIDARIMPTPGHTAGSISVLTGRGDLVAGDLVANSFMGLVPGRPANPPFHDDPLHNLASLRRMLDLDPTRLHVGHGTPLEPDRVRRWAAREHRRLTRLAAAGRLPTRTETEAV
ncbi:MBL fold metallo-hydrolase [Streptomyces sp. ICN441]|uniref:MBL fold metallo-hydrolase n=1 Tax=Streptomyces tirandamycinicus TaxID=2174846 RepID=A0A2S1SN02_9ACTN|nr:MULTISPECIES: MBL fold metallo-hydrolase [Streptomyces]AWI27760.1 MBL fold metallo-hydrolase [Streptomyces tirandamycinicus]NNJ06629.1 MBL fold metallo-hydrolase [Streptomyces sp. PKU-MA01144]TFE52832.1 MBL fold metallo-hydrolase [Streptomyces sp. ICN441]